MSPDRSRVLYKTTLETGYVLEVKSANGETEARLSLPENPWEVAWRPDGRSVAFLAADPVTHRGYRLYVWEITVSSFVIVDSLRTETAATPLKWSPDGQRLAYVVLLPGIHDLALVSVGKPESPPKVIHDVLPTAGFGWSADSKHVAFSRGAGTLWSHDVSSNTDELLARLPDPADEIRGIAWSPSPTDIVATVRFHDHLFYSIAFYRPHTGLTVCESLTGDAQQPMWGGSDKEYVFVLHSHGYDRAYRNRGCSPQRPLSGQTISSLRLLSDGFRYHEQVEVIESAPNSPPILKYLPKEVAGEAGGYSNLAEQLYIEGPTAPLPVWHIYAGHSIGKAVVFVHGGPHLEDRAAWDSLRQAFANYGFDVFALNYSGSAGYGSEFESRSRLIDQAHELETTVRYVRLHYNIPPESIVIYASSYGTAIALQTLNEAPRIASVIVLAPLLPRSVPNVMLPRTTALVIAMHGARDPISTPEEAKRKLQEIFAVNAPTHGVYWRVFGDEAHGFSRLPSEQEIFGTIVCATEVGCRM